MEQAVVIHPATTAPDVPSIPVDRSPVTPMQMLQIAVERGADLDRLQQLMDLQQRWEAAEAQKAYNQAFANFKAEAVEVIKNKLVTDGPLRGKRYAELYSVVNAVTPALSRHGLSASWKVTKDEKEWIEVTCTLKHVRGHAESVSMGGPPDAGGAKSAIQARASTISYLSRYTLKAVCGVAEQEDDDDGRSAPPPVEPDAEGKKALEACASLRALQEAWEKLTPAQRKTLHAVKEECKQRIRKADAQ